MAPESLLAAVDLGSNSFRLEIGRIGSHQRIERVEYLKEMVRLGGGLNAQNALRKSCKTLRNVWYMSACNGILTGHEAKQP